MVVTGGEGPGGEDVKANGGHTHGEGRRLDFGGEHAVECTDIMLQGGTPGIYECVMLLTKAAPLDLMRKKWRALDLGRSCTSLTDHELIAFSQILISQKPSKENSVIGFLVLHFSCTSNSACDFEVFPLSFALLAVCGHFCGVRGPHVSQHITLILADCCHEC